VECSIQIAWDYLDRSGELGDPSIASDLLLRSIEQMVRRGERHQLVLSNLAIASYRRFIAKRINVEPDFNFGSTCWWPMSAGEPMIDVGRTDRRGQNAKAEKTDAAPKNVRFPRQQE
jgi:hypothetical protein